MSLELDNAIKAEAAADDALTKATVAYNAAGDTLATTRARRDEAARTRMQAVRADIDAAKAALS